MRVRPFAEADYADAVAVSNRSFPEYEWTVEEIRHWDEGWEHDRYFKTRLVAEDPIGRLVGVVDVSHARGQFHPDHYRMELSVDPDHRRMGAGSALYHATVELLVSRRATQIRAGTKETMADGVSFLLRRGFAELKRDWESRLDLGSFDPGRFAAAPARVAAAGVSITNLAVELMRDGDVLRKAFELHEEARRDVPTLDPATRGTYERFERDVLAGPSSLPEAHFLATRDGRYVGESSMGREGTDPLVIYQHLTAVLPEERGKGVAMALKLATVEYARAHGYREIRTWNDSMNRPMLRINEALGFAKQPAWIEFGKELPPASASR
ncbi:MAG TPA: GNAT family N-acetyltransferase [Candidatus Limnocylindria bacterium]